MNILKLSLQQGSLLIKLARRAVFEYLTTGTRITPPKNLPKELMEKRGVFVTLRKIIVDEYGVKKWILRGCIGYVFPRLPLAQATINAAIAAATKDPRFTPLTVSELSQVIFEISILSNPEIIKVSDPSEYPRHIKIGLHGVVVEKGLMRGVLLPQTAVEYEWDARTFLSQACVKAGLPPDSWMLGDIKVYRFNTQIFAEIEPNGEIIERQLYLENEER